MWRARSFDLTTSLLSVPARQATLDDLVKLLPEDDCRYGVFDYHYKDKEGCEKTKIFFVSWCVLGAGSEPAETAEKSARGSFSALRRGRRRVFRDLRLPRLRVAGHQLLNVEVAGWTLTGVFRPHRGAGLRMWPR